MSPWTILAERSSSVAIFNMIFRRMEQATTIPVGLAWLGTAFLPVSTHRTVSVLTKMLPRGKIVESPIAPRKKVRRAKARVVVVVEFDIARIEHLLIARVCGPADHRLVFQPIGHINH